MTTHWHPGLLARNLNSEGTALPTIDRSRQSHVIEGRYFWDHSPVFDGHGDVFTIGGSELWTGLSAPVSDDPVSRHEHARLRLVKRRDGRWIDCGNILPDNFSHGSRDWAGVMSINQSNFVTLFYTATGTRGEQVPTYRQRIFQATAMLSGESGRPAAFGWQDRGEPISADGNLYEIADQSEGAPGAIISFRDPYPFIDPQSGQQFMLFAATDARARTKKNGAIGIARLSPESGVWILQNPIVTGDGTSNEMERPHLIFHQGGYYLFWSVHGWTFGDGIKAPTGLYGMFSENLLGPYQPLNGHSLVASNPKHQPYQAYSWLVLKDFQVTSFVDMLDGKLETHPGAPHYPVGHFEGTEAPTFRLELKQAEARIVRQVGEAGP